MVGGEDVQVNGISSQERYGRNRAQDRGATKTNATDEAAVG